jgi:hypothetical protein
VPKTARIAAAKARSSFILTGTVMEATHTITLTPNQKRITRMIILFMNIDTKNESSQMSKER